MERIDHFLHHHPLTLTDTRVLCSGCRKGSSLGPIYGCTDCGFYLHKSCADLPGEIQNFTHPCPLVLKILSYTCNACFGNGYGFSYRCQSCDFDMHVDCALPPTIKSDGDEHLILHFTHRHPLTLLVLKDLQLFCRICEKLCCGSASAYGCLECDFFLHNSCMINMPRQINHSSHPSCPLILLTTRSDLCENCDENGSGLVFRCGKCRFQLDVKCALLNADSQDNDRIRHSLHKHTLALYENKDIEYAIGVRCRACGENCLSSCCFGCARCNFFLHRPCAVELPQEIRHPFHPLHPLNLSSLPPVGDASCTACGGSNDPFLLAYRCADCNLNLHIHCAKPNLAPLLKYEGHSHYLTFFDQTPDSFLCDICYEEARNCFFRCVACEFDMHLYCHPSAPQTIKHKSHLHPLTLTPSPLKFEFHEDEDSSDDEFYCDVCEEKRWKPESVYYCAECKFIAEGRCVMSELLPSLTFSKGQGTANGRVISIDEENSAIEATIAKLNNEIADLRAKEEPLKVEIEKHNALARTLELELEPIQDTLKELEIDHFLYNYQLNHLKDNN